MKLKSLGFKSITKTRSNKGNIYEINSELLCKELGINDCPLYLVDSDSD